MSEQANEKVESHPLGMGRSILVLVVDDDPLVSRIVAAMLEEMGHRTLVAASAREALGIVRVQPVDLVITDYLMPEMTGAQLVEAARRERPALRCVFLTAYAGLEDIDRRVPRIAKPCLFEDLEAAVSGLLRERG